MSNDINGFRKKISSILWLEVYKLEDIESREAIYANSDSGYRRIKAIKNENRAWNEIIKIIENTEPKKGESLPHYKRRLEQIINELSIRESKLYQMEAPYRIAQNVLSKEEKSF